MIELERGSAKWEFCPLPVRTFRTIEVDVSNAPDLKSQKAIEKKDIQNAVVRLI